MQSESVANVFVYSRVELPLFYSPTTTLFELLRTKYLVMQNYFQPGLQMLG